LQALNSLPLVSIVILNYNGQNYLNNCLTSVLNNNYPNYEVLLVDNDSKDSSFNDAKTLFGNESSRQIYSNHANLGFSGGNNAGFEHCNGEYVVFLNNDTLVEPNWLTSINALETDASIGLASQSLILMMDGQTIQTGGWIFSNYLVFKHALGEKKPATQSFKPVFEVPIASGASMIIKKSLIVEIGLFDSAIPFFYDDTLLSFKVLACQQAGSHCFKLKNFASARCNKRLEHSKNNV
jgi:GT2 family glycosyltransferase